MAIASASTSTFAQPSDPSSSSSMSSSQAPRQSLLQNLSTQSILITQLFSLLSSPPPSSTTGPSTQSNFGTSPNPSAQAIEQIYAAIQLSTLDLSSLVKETYEHQAEWQRFLAKKKEVENLEKRVRGVMRRLEGSRGELEGMVEAGRAVRNDIEKSERAQSISKHTSAPIPPTSSADSGAAAIPTVIDKSLYAPWPSEMNMRQGLLFQLEGSMGGMGERGVVGDELASTTNQAQGELGQQPEAHQASAPTHVHHEEPSRRYDPNAVFDLALNSDSDDD
ncbi:hypothetical protein IAT40_000258 [Kwoniella sp. CBS 6097]